MKWRWWRTTDEMAADFAADRLPEGNEKFISDCGLPDTQLARRVAIAIRRSVARYGMVESDFIHANDMYPDQLIELSGWDSIDFMEWVWELEQELGVPVSSKVFEEIWPTFCVNDLAEAVYDFMVLQEEVAE